MMQANEVRKDAAVRGRLHHVVSGLILLGVFAVVVTAIELFYRA